MEKRKDPVPSGPGGGEPKFRIRPGYILREIAGEYTIIPYGTEGPLANTILSPNETAAFLFRAFETPATIEEVVGRVMAEYDGTAEEIRTAAASFVLDALKYQMIEEVTEDESSLDET